MSNYNGKIFLGGAESESLASFGITDSPIVNIKPNAESILEAVENILENRDNIEQLGLESRYYVEKNHDYKIVAEQYLNIWKKN